MAVIGLCAYSSYLYSNDVRDGLYGDDLFARTSTVLCFFPIACVLTGNYAVCEDTNSGCRWPLRLCLECLSMTARGFFLTERYCEERSNLYAVQRNLQSRSAYVEIASFLAMTCVVLIWR